jgi:hypothetical protein
MSNTTPRRPYSTGPNSKRQQIIRYFRENPDARPVDVAREFKYSPGATHGCKKIAVATPLPVKSHTMSIVDQVNKLAAQRWVENTPAQKAEPAPEIEPADPWRAFGEWMTREQFIGYLRGVVVSKVSRPLASYKDVMEASRAAAKLAELMGE